MKMNYKLNCEEIFGLGPSFLLLKRAVHKLAESWLGGDKWFSGLGWALVSGWCHASLAFLGFYLSVSFLLVVLVVFYFVSIITLFLSQPMSFTFSFWFCSSSHWGRGEEWVSAWTVLSCRLGLNHATLSHDPRQGTSNSFVAPSSFLKLISSGSTWSGEPK